MDPDEIAQRLAGLVPVSGGDQPPPPRERRAAEELLAYLADRRLLYAVTEVENPGHCIKTAQDMRRHLSALLADRPGETLAVHLAAMRAACSAFVDAVQLYEREMLRVGPNPRHFASWEFMDALGMMRARFGTHIGLIAVRFGLSVDDKLSRLLPPPKN